MVKEVMRCVIEGPGMEYSRDQMLKLRNEAVQMLDTFEDSPAKKSLIELDFTIERNK